MEPRHRSALIYGLVLGVWLLLIGWQTEEHLRFREAARVTLVNRAKDISTTLGIVLRSQRRFGGFVSKERLEESLGELVNQETNELSAIALLNGAGEVVASAGSGIDSLNPSTLTNAESWGTQTVTLFNPVDLGTNLTRDIEGTNLPIIVSRQDITNRFGAPPRPPPGPPSAGNDTNTPPSFAAGGPPPGEGFTNGPRRPEGPPRFGRPRWMSPEEYQDVLQKKGVHSFAIIMSTLPLHAAFEDDSWLRSIIVLFAGISAIGIGLAWRNVFKTSDLQIRLVRASEINSHLKEMNLAAAGLAHETRNPLNIIRGMAQMISKSEASSADLREKARAIVDETDKVTAQLNEFINYSRPREVRRTKASLNAIVTEVVRALNYDIEEKKLRVESKVEPFLIEADEQLLRQVLFNLLLNSIQAAGENGQIQFSAHRNGSEATFEIRDDGPGVPPEQRREIFKPYFTTHQKGTGLGLAVVQQIVLVHGWEIECLGNEPKGAVFRISHLKPAA